MNDLRVRPFEAGDEAAFLACHNRSFPTPRSTAHWRWLYRDNPLRQGCLVGAFTADGTCVAAHGGVPLRFLLDGVETRAMLHVDSAVAPERRRGLGGGRLSALVNRAFFARHGPPLALMWGFPEPGLRRVTTRFVRVEIANDVVFLANQTCPVREVPAAIDVTRSARVPADADDLWHACCPLLRASVIRDRAHFEWRYGTHPEIDYWFLVARDARTRALRGLAVLRDGGWLPDALSLADWLVAAPDVDAERVLVDAAFAEVRARGRRGILAWFTAASPAFHRFQVDHGFFAVATPYQQVFRSWTEGVDREWLHAHWQRSMGDMDFF